MTPTTNAITTHASAARSVTRPTGVGGGPHGQMWVVSNWMAEPLNMYMHSCVPSLPLIDSAL